MHYFYLWRFMNVKPKNQKEGSHENFSSCKGESLSDKHLHKNQIDPGKRVVRKVIKIKLKQNYSQLRERMKKLDSVVEYSQEVLFKSKEVRARG
jgi:hypothetical protein